MTGLRAGSPVAVGPVRITPLEQVRVEGAPGGGGLFLYAAKTPIGLVISTPDGDRAVDLQGRPMDLGRLRETVEGFPDRGDSCR